MANYFSSPPTATAAALLLALVGLAALVRLRSRSRGTTLVAVWTWSILSLLILCAAEILIVLENGSSRPTWAASLRFAAAMSTFCPIMALLGAKRPQDRGWQLIVVTLWAILALPSFEWLLFGSMQEIHPARFWFLMILTATGALNGIATRLWPSSALFCLAQMALIAPFLPSTRAYISDRAGPLWAMTLLAGAWALWAFKRPRACATATRLDRVWLNFRDAYGAVWSLRVMERMNASASMYDWPVKLTWAGFRAGSADASIDEVPETVEESLRALLRRFVSPQWIARVAGDRPCLPAADSDGPQEARSEGSATRA